MMMTLLFLLYICMFVPIKKKKMKFKNYKNIEGQFVKIFVFFIKNIICLLKTVYIDDFSN